MNNYINKYENSPNIVNKKLDFSNKTNNLLSNPNSQMPIENKTNPFLCRSGNLELNQLTRINLCESFRSILTVDDLYTQIEH